ncbi:MAG TPA: transglycosylase SLT domain-containing protein [Microlunatus sp.]
MSAVAAGVAVVGLTDLTGSATGAPVTVVTPSPASVDTSVRDERATRGDLRPAMATTQQRRQAAQRVAELGAEGDAIAVREAKLEAKAKKKTLAKKKAAAKKRKAELARIKELGYEPGTSNPRAIARQILKNKYGYGNDQYQCFNNIIIRESNWDINATNASSGAYGIPQSLPGNKMASVGDDWRTNPATQITWGIEYMKDRYGSPCSAWGFKSSHGWY